MVCPVDSGPLNSIKLNEEHIDLTHNRFIRIILALYPFSLITYGVPRKEFLMELILERHGIEVMFELLPPDAMLLEEEAADPMFEQLCTDSGVMLLRAILDRDEVLDVVL